MFLKSVENATQPRHGIPAYYGAANPVRGQHSGDSGLVFGLFGLIRWVNGVVGGRVYTDRLPFEIPRTYGWFVLETKRKKSLVRSLLPRP